MEALNSAPVLKGYIVQKGDTLWKLAKENQKRRQIIDYKILSGIMKKSILGGEYI